MIRKNIIMEINEKKLESILTEQRKEYQRYLGILTESFKSQVKLVAEQYGDIKQTLNSHTAILNSHTEIIGLIQIQISAIREMIAKNTEDIEMIKMDLHIIKDDIKEKVNRDEFRILEKRIESLEKNFQKA